MNKQDFLDKFYLEYDSVADLSAPGYTPLELSKISSKAQENLIITKYSSKSNRLNEGFEETEKRVEDIGELVRYKMFTSFTTGFFDNSIQIVLPNTLITSGPTDFSDIYWFTIYEGCVSDQLDCSILNNTTVFIEPEVLEVSHIRFPIAIRDPFSKPYISGNDGRVLRLRSEGRIHTIVTDGSFNITKYNIGYIRKPLPIDLTTSLTSEVSELSDEVHREILDLTIQYCLKIVGRDQEFKVDTSIPKE